MKKIIFAFLLSWSIISCSSIPSLSSKNTAKSTNLEDSHWVLEDQTLTSSTITLNIENNKISGNASCNSYFGDLSLDENNSISIQNIGTTRKHCNKMSAETYFLNILEKVNKYSATNSELSLYKDQTLLLKFKKK